MLPHHLTPQREEVCVQGIRFGDGMLDAGGPVGGAPTLITGAPATPNFQLPKLPDISAIMRSAQDATKAVTTQKNLDNQAGKVRVKIE